jgi:hypothetical protein
MHHIGQVSLLNKSINLNDEEHAWLKQHLQTYCMYMSDNTIDHPIDDPGYQQQERLNAERILIKLLLLSTSRLND